jgi:hypothetical protein
MAVTLAGIRRLLRCSGNEVSRWVLDRTITRRLHHYAHWWNTYFTGCWIVGEVMNTTQAPVYNVEVGQKTCDSSSQAVATDKTTTFLAEIAPGQLSSFDLRSGESLRNRIRLCGQSNVLTWSTGISNSVESATVLTRTLLTSNDQFGLQIARVDGTLRNDSTHMMSPTVAVVTLYNRDGSIVDARAYRAERLLEAGTVMTFTVVFNEWPWYQYYSGRVVYYTVQAQGTTELITTARTVMPATRVTQPLVPS